ncbi:hypothetical protein, partial [Winogradskya humida]|uniref:hypothetical protein n=1 Tax=Winogradskya humida TaxID=113566 RepID=UPI0031DCDE9F
MTGSITKYVKPDSVLARTAWEMLQSHAGGQGPHDGITICPVCGERLPCTAGRAAAEVVAAAGLAESSGLIAATRSHLPIPPPTTGPLTMPPASNCSCRWPRA